MRLTKKCVLKGVVIVPLEVLQIILSKSIAHIVHRRLLQLCCLNYQCRDTDIDVDLDREFDNHDNKCHSYGASAPEAARQGSETLCLIRAFLPAALLS